MSESLENRVSKIEEDLVVIKLRLGEPKSKPDWITKTAGAFRGDEVFAEIVRLGKELRDAQGDDGEE